MAKAKRPSWNAHDATVKPYRRAHRVITIGETAARLLLLATFLFSPLALDYEATLLQYGSVFAAFAFLGTWFAVERILTLPFDAGAQSIERQFGLSKQPWKSWLGDLGKAFALGGVFGALVLGALILCLSQLGDRWWVGAAVLSLGATVLLVQLAPVVLVPIFYPMNPLPEGSLRTRLLALCDRFKIPVKEVYSLELGAKTEKGNAAFFGLGRTKRIAVGDTLYKKFSEDEVEAVFAHELGHEQHNDLWKGIGTSAIGTFCVLGASAFLYDRFLAPNFGPLGATPRSFLLLSVALFFAGLPLKVALAAFSRSRERAADRFAAGLGLSKPLASALERLTVQNRGVFYPNALAEWALHSHPAPSRRIERLEAPPTA